MELEYDNKTNICNDTFSAKTKYTENLYETPSIYIYDTCQKKEKKMDDVKSLFNYIGQPVIKYISTAPKKCHPWGHSTNRPSLQLILVTYGWSYGCQP